MKKCTSNIISIMVCLALLAGFPQMVYSQAAEGSAEPEIVMAYTTGGAPSVPAGSLVATSTSWVVDEFFPANYRRADVHQLIGSQDFFALSPPGWGIEETHRPYPGTLYYGWQGQLYRVMDDIIEISGHTAEGIYLVRMDKTSDILIEFPENYTELLLYDPESGQTQVVLPNVACAYITPEMPSRLLYGIYEEGYFSIYLLNLATNEATRLFRDTGADSYSDGNLHAAHYMNFFEEGGKLYAGLYYTFPSNIPYFRYLVLDDITGTVLEDSEKAPVSLPSGADIFLGEFTRPKGEPDYNIHTYIPVAVGEGDFLLDVRELHNGSTSKVGYFEWGGNTYFITEAIPGEGENKTLLYSVYLWRGDEGNIGLCQEIVRFTCTNPDFSTYYSFISQYGHWVVANTGSDYRLFVDMKNGYVYALGADEHLVAHTVQQW